MRIELESGNPDVKSVIIHNETERDLRLILKDCDESIIWRFKTTLNTIVRYIKIVPKQNTRWLIKNIRPIAKAMNAALITPIEFLFLLISSP